MKRAEKNLVLLLSDMKGFTERTSRQTREENARMLALHDALLLPVVRGYHGHKVKGLGDALVAAFLSPTDAVLCAMAMQDRLAAWNARALPGDRIEIRIALSQGEVRRSRGDVHGEAMQLALEAEARAEAGEVVLTDAVYLSMNKTEAATEVVGEVPLHGGGRIRLRRAMRGTDPIAPYGGRALARLRRLPDPARAVRLRMAAESLLDFARKRAVWTAAGLLLVAAAAGEHVSGAAENDPLARAAALLDRGARRPPRLGSVSSGLAPAAVEAPRRTGGPRRRARAARAAFLGTGEVSRRCAARPRGERRSHRRGSPHRGPRRPARSARQLRGEENGGAPAGARHRRGSRSPSCGRRGGARVRVRRSARCAPATPERQGRRSPLTGGQGPFPQLLCLVHARANREVSGCSKVRSPASGSSPGRATTRRICSGPTSRSSPSPTSARRVWRRRAPPLRRRVSIPISAPCSPGRRSSTSSTWLLRRMRTRRSRFWRWSAACTFSARSRSPPAWPRRGRWSRPPARAGGWCFPRTTTSTRRW
ncbi:MAG: adenylate/guanylate cyclase domain-containing protein [Deltaproteobacteria bacterium]|nr:MAG: adenylate/guanylate cyclase domain-containing protein [Deltaproteobacteria bacterium]